MKHLMTSLFGGFPLLTGSSIARLPAPLPPLESDWGQSFAFHVITTVQKLKAKL